MSIRLNNADKRTLSTPFSVEKALELTHKKTYRRRMGRKKQIQARGAELRTARERMELTQEEVGIRLADVLGYVVDQKAISKIEREVTKGGDIKSALLKFYGLQLKGILPSIGHNAMRVINPPLNNNSTLDPVPVYRTWEAEGGFMRIAKQPSGNLRRPDYLVDSKAAYAIEMRGDTMVDRIFPGETLYVNPDLPIKANTRGTYLYVFLNADRSQWVARTLVSYTDEQWQVRQQNPRLEYALSRAEWPFAERINGVQFHD